MTEKQSLNDWIKDLEKFTIPSYEEWEKVALASLKGKPLDQLFTKTYEGITLKPVYTRNDVKEGIPQYNKTEGNTWNISQEIYSSTIEEVIKSIEQAKTFGQTSVNLELYSRETDRGVKFKNTQDVFRLFDSISNNGLTFFINSRLQQSPFIASLLSYQKEREIELNGVIGSDPISEWVKTGQLPSELSSYYDEMAAVLKQVSQSSIRTILVQSHPVHNGGAHAVQELAYTLSVAIEYVRQSLDRGLTINEVAPHFAFSFSIGSNLFMEIAKLRAAKYLWSAIVKEFGGNTESGKMWIHARTSRTTKTKYDPYVNMLRATVESFAAVIGGANSIHTSTFDEPYETASKFSERIARNVQSILKEESHLSRVVDPSGGSWYIENLTKQLAEKTWEYIQTIEEKGGVTSAFREGFIQKEVRATRNQRFEKIDYRKEKIVGTNMYAQVNDQGLPEKEIRQELDVEQNVQSLKLKLSFSDKIFFNQINGELQKGASFQEVEVALRSKEKEQPIEGIPSIRWSTRFETLRDNATAYQKKTGKDLSVQLINLGQLAKHKPRTDFTKGFFEVGGFRIIQSQSYLTVDEAEAGIANNNEQVFVICGHDETYLEMGIKVTELLKAQVPSSIIYLAGKLGSDTLKEYQDAGLTDCIHVNTNCYEFLLNLQKKLGGYHEDA
jgi:methylmalonyl-CoA mutase